MLKSFLRLKSVAVGDKGTRLRGILYFPEDPGYRDTARMIIEAGLSLSVDLDKIKSEGGLLTPASGQGDVLV